MWDRVFVGIILDFVFPTKWQIELLEMVCLCHSPCIFVGFIVLLCFFLAFLFISAFCILHDFQYLSFLLYLLPIKMFNLLSALVTYGFTSCLCHPISDLLIVSTCVKFPSLVSQMSNLPFVFMKSHLTMLVAANRLPGNVAKPVVKQVGNWLESITLQHYRALFTQQT